MVFQHEHEIKSHGLVRFKIFCNRSLFIRRLPSRASVFCRRCVKRQISPSAFFLNEPDEQNSMNEQHNVEEQVNIDPFYGHAAGHARLFQCFLSMSQYVLTNFCRVLPKDLAVYGNIKTIIQ